MDRAIKYCIYGDIVYVYRGVSGYLELGGQVVMWRTSAAKPPPGGAFYSAKNMVGNCPPCPLATYAPGVGQKKSKIVLT